MAAVEAGLVTVFLSPLLLGVLWFGDHFWQQQHKQAYDPRVSQQSLFGEYGSCEQLLTAVRNSVVVNVNNVSGVTPIDLDAVTAEVVDFLPDQLGVDVRLSVRVPKADSAVSGLLPDNGDLVAEALTRLENVRLTTQSC